MSAKPATLNRQRSGVCASRSPKSGEGSCEGTDEASDEGSGDALRIRVSFGHPPFPFPGEYRGVGGVYKRA
jgi:hypothetical protein